MYTLFVHEYLKSIICFHVYKKGFKIGIQNVYMILNAENVKCIHFVYIIVYIIYTAMYTLCTFSCIHFVSIISVREGSKTRKISGRQVHKGEVAIYVKRPQF